ncbi:MAG: DUF6797 domain-containing protein [Pirellulaceae bacterium]|nr:DUF6797 domain-containing protein [Pirellulaceae bacterium]
MSFLSRIAAIIGLFILLPTASSEPLRKAESLDQLLKAANVSELAREARLRGDPQRGALIFYRSAAACVNCHASGDGASPLGPNLAKHLDGSDPKTLSDEYLIESLLLPSKVLRKGYETTTVLTEDGTTVTGILVSESAKQLVLRTALDLEHPVAIDVDTIEARATAKQSMMPDGLMSALKDQNQFWDLAAYVFQVALGGDKRAAELKPTAEQLAITEDWLNLDHAGILKKIKAKDFEAGEAIYHGYCVECHGPDGNRPSLPTARAFGTQKLKFGDDPYKMFMTLSRGNGLMGPTSHLTPNERYQVVHYIRERFMKPTNPDYVAIDHKYLDSLPKGTEDGTAVPTVDRDFGLALGSQLDRRFPSVLTMNLGDVSICYDLHTMNQADIWSGGFLDLDQTQHIRARGEGTANPKGKSIPELQGWQWGHDGTLDYSRKDILPRGPLPLHWIDYHGYYLEDSQVRLSYQIDRREIFESVIAEPESKIVRHQLTLGPGRALVLGVMNGAESESSLSRLVAVLGEAKGLEWSVDAKKRVVLSIPADDTDRSLEVVCNYGDRKSSLDAFRKIIADERNQTQAQSPASSNSPRRLLWPEILKTVGTRGLQRGAYALDTIAIPESTPWKTWFRTSALDFMSDGRMVVTTYGGDVWIVSGIDDSLLKLEWKRFAAGLYEPMGVVVVDDTIFVTCKDRIVRLRDFDENGEADFYESFSPETDVSFHFHSFNFDLQRDSKGYFYYSKGGHDADFSLPGAVIQVSPDGKNRSVFATGFRVPNGMGWMPGDRITCSDNQGQWMPASKISLLKQGGFYGWVPTYDGKGKWAPDGGKIDIKKVVPPKTFDQPMIWMPQEFDNSSGGQLWVDDARWGPLAGRLLHTSFGKGWLSYLMTQEIDSITQAAVIRLPFDFRTGIMRARVNPKDGQVYATGLQGWNGSGRIGLLDQGIQRLRYTGKPIQMISNCQVDRDGLSIDFNFRVDLKSAGSVASYSGKQWNYRWQSAYGSEMYSPTTGEIGADKIDITSVRISENQTRVKLHLSNLQPVNQLHLILKLNAEDGSPFEEEVYWTIHRIPK